MKIVAVFFIAWVFTSVSGAYCDEGAGPYNDALEYIEAEQYDFAMMEFRSVVRNFPESEHARKAVFALGEYFYNRNILREAIKYFSDCVKKYPGTGEQIFARAYLLRIIKDIENYKGEKKHLSEKIENEFFSEPLFLLFSEYKELTYKSAFHNAFTVHYYVDTIEIYKNGDTFIKITQ